MAAGQDNVKHLEDCSVAKLVSSSFLLSICKCFFYRCFDEIEDLKRF